MIPIYVIHHKPLEDRKNYISRILPYAEFVESPSYSVNLIPTRSDWKNRTDGLYSGEIPFRDLSYGDMDCTSKHYTALTEISNLISPGLILEDDAILLNGFYDCIKDVQQKKNSSMWDILFIGGAFPHTVAPSIYSDFEEDMMPFIPKGHPCTNTVCSYIVKPDIAAAIAHHLYRYGAALPIDFEMNYICKELKLRVCHYLPYVVREGSSAGFYKGSQQR